MASELRPVSKDMRDVLGSKRANLYNRDVCCALSGSSVKLLDVWLLTAVMGSSESWRVGDCSHAYILGAVPTAWNQMLLASADNVALPDDVTSFKLAQEGSGTPLFKSSSERVAWDTKWNRLLSLLQTPLPAHEKNSTDGN